MDFRLFEEFMLVTQHKSIRKAAQQLQISPAALSQRMTALEQTVGTALLLRSSHSTTLTEAGTRFARDVETFLRQYQQTLNKVAAHDEHLFSSLRVVISSELIPYSLASVLDSLSFRYPNLHIDLLDDRDYAVEQSLLSGEVDLYCSFFYGETYSPEIIRDSFFPSRMYAVLRNDHRLAGRPLLSLDDLDREQLILYPPTADNHIRQRQLDMLNRSGIRYSVYETETPHSLFTFLLPIGKGILLTPWLMNRKLTPNSVVIPLDAEMGMAEYSMFYNENNSNPALQKIVREVRQFTREEVQP